MRSLELLFLACATCFAMAPASLNVSKKLRSLSETRSPLPVTPFCRDSHSWSVKSVFVAIDAPSAKEMDWRPEVPDPADAATSGSLSRGDFGCGDERGRAVGFSPSRRGTPSRCRRRPVDGP